MTSKKELEKLSFEQALEELEKVVRALEEGEGGLQSSIESYEYGMKLKKICEDKLKDAQTKIEKITIDAEGNVAKEDFAV